MTNREALNHGIERFHCDEIKDEETGEVIMEEHWSLPITGTVFLKNMAALLVGVTDMLLAMDFPTARIGIDVVGGGKAKVTLYAPDYINVLIGNDMLRGTSLTMQLNGFLNWWLEQEAETEDVEHLWCDFDTLAEKWNEYARIRQED